MNDETEIGQLLRHHFAGTARRQVFDTGALDAVTRQVARTAQDRPRWWLPAGTSLRGTGRLAVVCISTLLALLLLGSALYLGSSLFSPHPSSLPQPYGLAANGALVYASGGDLWTSDAHGGGAHAIVTGPEQDLEPVFSHDGTRLAFMRTRSDGPYDLMVALADGSAVRQLAADVGGFAWSPDDSQLAVVGNYPTTVSVVDAVGSSPTKFIDVAPFSPAGWVAWRPPHGSELIFEVYHHPSSPVERAIFAVRADGTGLRMVGPFAVDHGMTWSYADPQLTPDGSAMVYADFTMSPVADTRVERRDLDTGHVDVTSIRASTSARLSPDGGSILYLARTPDRLFYGSLNRSSPDVPVGPVLDLHDGLPRIDLSPDGREAIVEITPVDGAEATTRIIDIATGTEEALPAATSFLTWQRLAFAGPVEGGSSASSGVRP